MTKLHNFHYFTGKKEYMGGPCEVDGNCEGELV